MIQISSHLKIKVLSIVSSLMIMVCHCAYESLILMNEQLSTQSQTDAIYSLYAKRSTKPEDELLMKVENLLSGHSSTSRRISDDVASPFKLCVGLQVPGTCHKGCSAMGSSLRKHGANFGE